MPRDGGFLREVAARDKTWSQQAGDLYLPVLCGGRHLREHVRDTHSATAKVLQRQLDIDVRTGVPNFSLERPQYSHANVRES